MPCSSLAKSPTHCSSTVVVHQKAEALFFLLMHSETKELFRRQQYNYTKHASAFVWFPNPRPGRRKAPIPHLRKRSRTHARDTATGARHGTQRHSARPIAAPPVRPGRRGSAARPSLDARGGICGAGRAGRSQSAPHVHYQPAGPTHPASRFPRKQHPFRASSSLSGAASEAGRRGPGRK